MRLPIDTPAVTPVSQPVLASLNTLRLGSPEEALFGLGKKLPPLTKPNFATGYTAAQGALIGVLKNMPSRQIMFPNSFNLGKFYTNLNVALITAYNNAVNQEHFPKPNDKFGAWQSWATAYGEALLDALAASAGPGEQYSDSRRLPEVKTVYGQLDKAIKAVLAEAETKFADTPVGPPVPELKFDTAKLTGYSQRQVDLVSILISIATVITNSAADAKRVQVIDSLLAKLPAADAGFVAWKPWLSTVNGQAHPIVKTLDEGRALSHAISALLVDLNKGRPVDETPVPLPSVTAPRTPPAPLPVGTPPQSLRLPGPAPVTPVHPGTSVVTQPARQEIIVPPRRDPAPSQPKTINLTPIDVKYSKVPAKPQTPPPAVRVEQLQKTKQAGRKAAKELRGIGVKTTLNKLAEKKLAPVKARTRLEAHVSKLITQHVTGEKPRLTNGQILARPKVQDLMQQADITSDRHMHRVIKDLRAKHGVSDTKAPAKKTAAKRTTKPAKGGRRR